MAVLEGRRKRWGGVLAAVAMIATPLIVLNVRDPREAGNRRGRPVTTATSSACPWLDPALPVATRVSRLIAAMTPLQEATMLHLRQMDSVVPFQGYTPAIPELCIPPITEQDGAAGVAMDFPGVTQLPAPIADAAAFDPSLALRYGSVIGAEDAAKGIDLALSPTINIDRSPLWGRSYETLGEDPYLAASLSAPLVRGIQSNRVVSILKHFAVYNQEAHRGTLTDNAVVDDRAIHEIYLPAFLTAVQGAKAGAVMCSYNLVNGTPACQNQGLINGVLRKDWHFNGFVRSDCGSVYDQAAAMAVGVSQVKCTHLYNPATLAAEVNSGKLSRGTLDALIRPLLTVLFNYNLIANPHPLDRDLVATTPAHQAVALATANQGSVLLKNDNHLLPLNLARTRSLALIGPAGGTPMPAGFGAMHVTPSHPVTALAALRGALGSRVRYATGVDIAAAADLAKRSEVAVVVVHDVEAERHDRTSLSLPGNQDALVSAVAAANPRTIVVLETGSAVLMPWVNSVPSILETWYPGEVAGTSLVDLLSGSANPSGKLPVTFPASAAAMSNNTLASFGGVAGRTQYTDGIDVGYRWYDKQNVRPAFSFGFGLSYTSFRFSNLHTSPGKSGGVQVQATITNDGRVRGADVVQCYLGAPPNAGEPPRQLRAFARVDLAPGQSTTVQLQLSRGDLATWDSAAQSWVVVPGQYRLWVGDGSALANLPLTTTVAVDGAMLGVNSGPATP